MLSQRSGTGEPIPHRWANSVFELRMPATVPRMLEDRNPTCELDRHRLQVSYGGDTFLNRLTALRANHPGVPALFLQAQVHGPGQLGNSKKGFPVADQAISLA